MRNFMEKLKDLLYDGIDYIIMVFVVVVVVLVINWRLDGLFAKDATDNLADRPVTTIEENNVNDNEDINDNSPTSEEEGSNDDSEMAENEETEENQKDDEDVEEKEIIQVTIPAGSLPANIGDILMTNGLIDDKDEFVNKVVELKMETRLKSGEYEIAKDSSLEEIIQILTK